MRNPFANLIRARDKPPVQDSVSEAMVFYFGGSSAGKTVTPRTASQISTVYACVRVIAETVASLPLHVEQMDADGSGASHAIEHPLYRLLHDEPNPEMTSFTWRETMLTHLLLWGNHYSQIIRNGRGDVVALYPLLPENMEVDRNEAGRLFYTYTNERGAFTLRPDDVLHIPGMGFDGILGYSPIAMERNALGLTLAAEEYGSKFFSQGARPAGVLTHPGTVKDTNKLRNSWNAAYGGSSNAGKVAILEEGMKFERVSVPNNEAQFLELRKFQTDEICRIFRVPPHMVGDLEHATYSNIEHQSINFAQYTVAPWVCRIEQSMNRSLLPKGEKIKLFAHFNVDGLMRGDYKSRMEGYAVARQNGWMSANDIHRLENLPLIPREDGGDEYLVNGNMISLRSAKDNLTSAMKNANSQGKENQ